MKRKNIRLAILGAGTVPNALLRYVQQDAAQAILASHGHALEVTGIATGSRGNAINADGIDLAQLAMLGKDGAIFPLNRGPETKTAREFVKNVPADILLVATPAGMPSVEEIKTALERGMDVVTSNKTPMAEAYRLLTETAKKYGRHLRFGATVLAGYPPWRHFFEAIEKPDIAEMQIVVNSTSNQILTMMHDEGKTFAEGIARAQELGIAERDPSDDVDGHDTQKKLAILASALMGAVLTPADIPTTGIREVTVEELRQADRAGKWIQLLGRAWKDIAGGVHAEVTPKVVDNPFFVRMRGTSMGLYFITPPGNFGFWLDLGKGRQAIMATAAGVFEDILTIAKTL